MSLFAFNIKKGVELYGFAIANCMTFFKANLQIPDYLYHLIIAYFALKKEEKFEPDIKRWINALIIVVLVLRQIIDNIRAKLSSITIGKLLKR